jgi:hypothetical protein
MIELHQPVSSDLMNVGGENAVVVVREQASWFVASWRCSCGAEEGEVIQSTTPTSAAETGRASFRSHCATAHLK